MTVGHPAPPDPPGPSGLARSRTHAQELLAQACAALDASGLGDTRALRALADMVVNRTS